MISIKIIIFATTVVTVCSLDSAFVPLDMLFLNNLFTQNGQFFVIKTGYPDTVLMQDPSKERAIKFSAYYNEQCIIECLKNQNCVRFSFNSTLAQCRIYVTQQRRKFAFDAKTASRIKDSVDVDLENCVNDLYCMDSYEKKSISSSICDPLTTSGDKCQYKNTYELSSWTEWTPCSLTCDQGFRQRERTCFRNYFDSVQNKMAREIVLNDGACLVDNKTVVEMTQVESCVIKPCLIHSEWSSWSSCSKLCDGTQNRARNCMLDDSSSPYCSSVYLNETQSCGLSNCSSLTLGKWHFYCFF